LPQQKPEVLLIGPLRPVLAKGLSDFNIHTFAAAANSEAFLTRLADVRAAAVSAPVIPIDGALFACLPKLQIVASFGVGYDHIDANEQRNAASW